MKKSPKKCLKYTQGADRHDSALDINLPPLYFVASSMGKHLSHMGLHSQSGHSTIKTSVRKGLFVAAALFTLILVVCLVPHRKETVTAFHENLWTTSRDGWGSPIARGQNPEFKEWERTCYGIKWAWLVYDREVNGEAWSARVEPRAAWVYLIAASAISAMALITARKLIKCSQPVRTG